MAASTADIKNGLCIVFNGKIATIIDFQHVKPGKGPAFVRTKLKYIESGKVVDNTFSAGHKIDVVRVETRDYQYLFKEGDMYTFMNTENYEQVIIEEKMINAPQFLKEGEIAVIIFDANNEEPLVCELKPFLNTEVTYTEPGIKGDTATNSLKPATIETGAEVKVPLFINIGDKIKIDTRTGTYSERIKA